MKHSQFSEVCENLLAFEKTNPEKLRELIKTVFSFSGSEFRKFCLRRDLSGVERNLALIMSKAVTGDHNAFDFLVTFFLGPMKKE